MPAKELLAREEELNHKSGDYNLGMAGRIAMILWLVGVCGSAAGLIAGVGIARSVTRSIVKLYVPVRVASGKLEEVIGPVDVIPSAGIENLDVLCTEWPTTSARSWTVCSRANWRFFVPSRWPPWGIWRPAWRTSCAIRLRP